MDAISLNPTSPNSGPSNADSPLCSAALPVFGEPWAADPADPAILLDINGTVVFDGYGSSLVEELDPVYAERVAACVNYCRGLATRQILGKPLLERVGNLTSELIAECKQTGGAQ